VIRLLPSTYAPLRADLKARVRAAQVKAAVAVNRELLLLYWHIGQELLRAQKAEGWGTKVVERLAKDLAAEFSEMGGFSRGNILCMSSSYAARVPVGIVSPPVSKLGPPMDARSGRGGKSNRCRKSCAVRCRLLKTSSGS